MYANARAYWELFDGADDDDRIRDLYLKMMIGGLEAPLAGDRYRVSVYGRRHINTANVATLHQEYIDLPDIGEVGLDEAWRYWRTVVVRWHNTAVQDIRCIVAKVEALLADTTYTKQNTIYVPKYADQSSEADPPPWGIRLVEYQVNASTLRRNITPSRVIKDIISPYWSSGGVSSSRLALRQLAYTELPYSRRQALDDINAMLDWDYGVWGASSFSMGPPSGTTMTVDVTDPQVSLRLNADVHETYNACRVLYTNRRGRPREVVVHAGGSDIPTPVKAKTFAAPEAVRTKSAALRCGERFLRNHKQRIVTGTATLTGVGSWGDSMLLRPVGKLRIRGVPRTFVGPHKITRVTLNPTQWSAELEFGVASRRFEMWLRRLEAGAHVRQR